ncbi:MAG TPA: hypothetical protein VFL64_19870 [Rhizobacter sp.]|nr:hypothetical protein [Rhizobacter sp.]
MKLPDFFDLVPRLRVRDPLAATLGCAEGGVLEYSYADAVRVTGHSCPTVAAAYWLTWLALAELYPTELPQRGGVRVEFRDHERQGSTGVFASVVQMLTGAANDGGFKGISGRFSRAGLQRISPDLPLFMRFTRLDDGSAVDAGVDLSLQPPDPELNGLLQRLESGEADGPALARLGTLWQRRVRELLIDRASDRGIFIVRRVERWRTTPPLRLNLRHKMG